MKKRKHPEADLQRACVKLAAIYEKQGKLRYFAVPNGEKRDAKTGAILKAMGVRAGVPDIELLAYKRTLYVELKADEKGTFSKDQKDWRDWLISNGHGYATTHTLNGFQRIMDSFVMGDTP